MMKIEKQLSRLLDLIIIACENAADNGYENQSEITKIKHALEEIIFYEDQT